MDLAVHNTYLLDIWWNVLIKFSRQIGNSCAKIINTKVNSEFCQTSEMELFSQVATGFRGELRILSNSYDKVFCKNSEKRKAVHYFCKKLHLGMLGKVLNMLLNWLSKLTMFHF